MKKKLFALLFAFVLSLSCAVPAFAATASHSRVADGAELLTDDEISALSDMLDEISSRQQMDVVVMTSDDLQGYDTATECADELYEYYGYGFGDEKDGIMLFISMDDRDWAISTCGRAIDVFSENDCDYIGDEIVPYLSDGVPPHSSVLLSFATESSQVAALTTIMTMTMMITMMITGTSPSRASGSRRYGYSSR